MSCNVIQHQRVKMIDNPGTLAAAASASSVWYPISGWTAKRIWVDQDSAGSASLKVDIRLSPIHYQVLRDATTVTTDDYKEYAVVAAQTAKTLTEYDDADVPDLKREAASAQIVVTANGGSADITSVIVWLNGLS